MATNSSIEWTEATWNPVTGCDRVSEGCDHCYAQTLAKRLKAMGSRRYQVDGDPRTSGPGFGVTLHHDQIDLPLRWRQPKTVFVNSMSDLFHSDVPDEFIAQVFAVMHEADHHTFQVLTKRPGRMASLLRSEDFHGRVLTRVMEHRPAEVGFSLCWPMPNVWLGTSVETQKWANVRIPKLLGTPAAVRFLSCEPLLGPVDLSEALELIAREGDDGHAAICRPSLRWVIVGGESGPGARPMHPDWARSLRDQSLGAGVPFFFKQWGGRTPKAGGRDLDGRTWDELPVPESKHGQGKARLGSVDAGKAADPREVPSGVHHRVKQPV